MMAGQTDLSNSILLAAYPATAITLLVVSLRVYVRTCYGQIFGWDDGAQIIAVVFAIAETIAVVLSTKHGAGKHIQDILPSEDISEGLKLNWISQLLYVAAMCTVKIAICLFLLRIATERLYRLILWSTIAVMAIYSLIAFFMSTFQCQPVSYVYDKSIEGRCFSIRFMSNFGFSYTGLNIATDLLLVLLPIYMVWGIKMTRQQKGALLFIFSLGFFVTAASIVKMAYLSSYGPSEDVLYTTVPLVKWAMVEINVANVTSSLPTLRPLFRRILEKSLSHPSKSTPNGPSHALQSLDYGAHKSIIRTTVDTKRNPNRHDSEENMIIASGGIAKTSEISVEIEEGDHSGQIRYGSRSTSPESTGVAHRPPV